MSPLSLFSAGVFVVLGFWVAVIFILSLIFHWFWWPIKVILAIVAIVLFVVAFFIAMDVDVLEQD